MKTRRLGRSGIRIAPLVLGGNVFGWTADQKTSFDILDRFADAGFDAIDTAECVRGLREIVAGSQKQSSASGWPPAHLGANLSRERASALQELASRSAGVLA